MGNPYESVTVANYNSNPPSDDGAETPSNRVQWSTHKTKIGDPLKTAIESVNTNVNSAIAKVIGGAGVTSTATTYEVTAGDQGKLVKVTASATITTPDAEEVGSPFVFSILNLHSAAITLEGNGSQTINGSPSLQVQPGDGYQISTDGADWFAIGRKTGVLPRGYIDGCILSNGTDATNDINIAGGVCRDSTNSVDITVAAMSGKQLDANWAPGATAGMRNSAAGIANGTYHIYAVAKADGTQDIYAHTSATVATVITALQAETGGADYLYARMIGSIVRASSAILGFVQRGDTFILKTPPLDIDQSIPTSASALVLGSIPTGISVEAITNVYVAITSTGAIIYISSLDTDDLAPSQTASPLSTASIVVSAAASVAGTSQVRVWTNTAAQIRVRASTIITGRMVTLGWVHSRGRDA